MVSGSAFCFSVSLRFLTCLSSFTDWCVGTDSSFASKKKCSSTLLERLSVRGQTPGFHPVKLIRTTKKARLAFGVVLPREVLLREVVWVIRSVHCES